LIKSEKMAAFGVMASRVAHEIQNPINFINNFSELSEELVRDIVSTGNEEPGYESASLLIENLKKINFHGKRAEAIVRDLQEHIRSGTTHEFFEPGKS
jgi:two-component system, NtrC family, sensor kinase